MVVALADIQPLCQLCEEHDRQLIHRSFRLPRATHKGFHINSKGERREVFVCAVCAVGLEGNEVDYENPKYEVESLGGNWHRLYQVEGDLTIAKIQGGTRASQLRRALNDRREEIESGLVKVRELLAERGVSAKV